MLTIVQSISFAARSKTTYIKMVYAYKFFFLMLSLNRALVSITLAFLNKDVLTPDIYTVWGLALLHQRNIAFVLS